MTLEQAEVLRAVALRVCREHQLGRYDAFVMAIRGLDILLEKIARGEPVEAPPSDRVPGAGTPIDLKDRNGNDVHIGDWLQFDEVQWGGPNDPQQVLISNGSLTLRGGVSCVHQFCEVVRRWNQ